MLSKFRIIDPIWLEKTVRTIEANNVDLGLMINASINSRTVCCILDTGSTFTLIPFKIFKLLNLNPTLLDSSVTYNINSVSHRVSDAVLGKMPFNVQITNTNGEIQSINQECLVSRDTLDLQYVLLGNDFLTTNSVTIYFMKDSKYVTINHYSVEMAQPNVQSNLVSFFSTKVTKISHKCRM